MNVNPADAEASGHPGRAFGFGDRMILAPVALNPSLDDQAIRMLAKQFSVGDRDGDNQPDARPVNSHFIRAFKKHHGRTPVEYRNHP